MNERLGTLAPDDAAARDDYGRGLWMAGRLDEAAAQLEAARALTPESAPAGTVMMREGEVGEHYCAIASGVICAGEILGKDFGIR